MIGSVGIGIQQSIEQNKLDKTASRQRQLAIEQQLLQQVGHDLKSESINSFITIPIANSINIAQSITIAEKALADANANSVIKTLQKLAQLGNINSGIDFVSLIADLQATSQSIQDDLLRNLFTNHCKGLLDNSINSPENWLRAGFGYLESTKISSQDNTNIGINCPFCQQSINTSLDIINAYTLQFNADFNLLVQRIKAHLTTLQNFNLETVIQTINNTKQTNIGQISSWNSHLPNTLQLPIFNIITNEVVLKADFQSLITTVEQKLQNPSLAVTITTANNFKAALEIISSNINVYNQGVITYNAGINTFLSSIQTISQAQIEVNRVKRIKKRFELSIDKLCTELITERQILKGLETAYTQLVKQQEIATSSFFTSYKNQINHYLGTVFKTLFRIDDVTNVPPQGRATQSKIGYKLTIDGQDISFDSFQQNNAKDSLSEGDKSTIALAFFLSKLDIDPIISNKVLVFDDPLSSFDSNRRMYTVQLIKDLFPKIKQIIVLSHNEFFLHELSKCFSPGDKKTLRIVENFLTKSSSIEPLILESMIENDYFKHIRELESFLQNPDLNKKDIVLGWLRNVIESHIRFKFHRQLSTLTTNNQTFGNLITTLIHQGVVFRDNANRTTILSKLNLINGISCKPHHGEPMPDFTTLGVNPNTINVTELANFVIDTLNLIDNEI